jgi:hypothetical protein
MERVVTRTYVVILADVDVQGYTEEKLNSPVLERL